MKTNDYISSIFFENISPEDCPFCESDQVILVVTRQKITPRNGHQFIIPDYTYSVCDNPACGSEFVTAKQMRHNDGSIKREQANRKVL